MIELPSWEKNIKPYIPYQSSNYLRVREENININVLVNFEKYLKQFVSKVVDHTEKTKLYSIMSKFVVIQWMKMYKCQALNFKTVRIVFLSIEKGLRRLILRIGE